MMLNLELLAQSGDHSIVQICSVVSDDPVGDTIPAYEVLLDEAGNHILCNGGEGSCFDPLGKVINGHQDEMVSIGCRRLDLSIMLIPHIANGQGSVRTLRGTRGICTLSS